MTKRFGWFLRLICFIAIGSLVFFAFRRSRPESIEVTQEDVHLFEHAVRNILVESNRVLETWATYAALYDSGLISREEIREHTRHAVACLDLQGELLRTVPAHDDLFTIHLFYQWGLGALRNGTSEILAFLEVEIHGLLPSPLPDDLDQDGISTASIGRSFFMARYFLESAEHDLSQLKQRAELSHQEPP